MTKNQISLPFALRRLAEVERARVNTEQSALAYCRLLALRAGSDPELKDQVDSVRAALDRLGKTYGSSDAADSFAERFVVRDSAGAFSTSLTRVASWVGENGFSRIP